MTELQREKEKDLPIICNKETTLAYQKAEVAGLSQSLSPGRSAEVVAGELHQHVLK